MVHQTITMKIHKASKASSKIRPMQKPRFLTRRPLRVGFLMAAIVGMLAACSVAPVVQTPPTSSPSPLPMPSMEDTRPLPPALVREQSRWVPVRWSELPGMDTDAVNEAWPAWLQSCQRPAPDWRALCPEITQLASASANEQRRWMREKLQPYRVEALDQRGEGLLTGLLTGYYEPALTGSRRPQGAFQVPLYAPPAQLGQRKPWFSRQEMETIGRAHV